MAINASITLSYPPRAPPPPPPTYSIHAAHPSPHSPYPHAIIADSATLDIPHANPWLITGAAPSAARPRWAAVPIVVLDAAGRWAARAQSPQPPARESEVLLLDEDVLERDLVTGRVGRCGARGCRRDVGCGECDAASRRDESPRTMFRGCVARGDLQEEEEEEEEEEFPIHLQRLQTPTVVVDMKPQQRTGPKIKYIRKRTLPPMERVVNKRRKTASGRFTK